MSSIFFFFLEKKSMMGKSLHTSSSSTFKWFNIYENPIVSFYLLWFSLRRRAHFLVSFWQGKGHLSRKVEPNGIIFNKNIYLIVQLLGNPSGYYFSLRNRMKALWHGRNKKGFSLVGATCAFFFSSSVTRLWQKQKFNWVAFLF